MPSNYQIYEKQRYYLEQPNLVFIAVECPAILLLNRTATRTLKKPHTMYLCKYLLMHENFLTHNLDVILSNRLAEQTKMTHELGGRAQCRVTM